MGVPEPLLIANIEKEETQCARTLYSSPSVSMSSADDTNTDLGVLKELHSEHAVGTYDVTVVTRPRKKLKIVEQGRSQPRGVMDWRSKSTLSAGRSYLRRRSWSRPRRSRKRPQRPRSEGFRDGAAA
jgi:hypothetical protein